MTPIDRLLSRLDNPKGRSPKWSCKCPAHEDRSPSLSVKVLDDGRVLVHCHAGCSASDVLAALGLTLGDLFPEPLGDYLTSRKYREPENRPREPAHANMQRTIDQLRARLSSR